MINQPSSHVEDRLGNERGIALIIALMAMLFMMALGSALLLSTITEKKIANNFRSSSEALYAADAGLERALDDLLTIPEWNTLIDGSSTSAFIDGAPGTRALADGTQLNLNEILAYTNCGKTSCTSSDLIAYSDERPWLINNPRWQLYAYGRLDDMIPTATVNSPFYIVVMVGDDPSETDNNPLKDGDTPVSPATTNPGKGVIAMRAEAFGPFGVHKTIELTVARTDTSELERGYTGQRGQDEQNRRARKAAVQ